MCCTQLIICYWLSYVRKTMDFGAEGAKFQLSSVMVTPDYFFTLSV